MTALALDWIDREKALRSSGGGTPLLQSEHEVVNARYPGTTLEYCCHCGEPTGRAGKGEDSLYAEDGTGPYKPECFHELFPEEA